MKTPQSKLTDVTNNRRNARRSSAAPQPPTNRPIRSVDRRNRLARYGEVHSGAHCTEVAANSRAIPRSGNHAITLTDLANFTANELWHSNSLLKHVLEARLRARQTPAQISRRCALSELSIKAYLRLLCERPSNFEQMGLPELADEAEINWLGWQLKMLASSSSPEELEPWIEALGRLEGPTLADGLPPQHATGLAASVCERINLAKLILPPSPEANELSKRLDQAIAPDRQTQDEQQLAMRAFNVLRQVELSVKLQGELALLREFRLMPADNQLPPVG